VRIAKTSPIFFNCLDLGVGELERLQSALLRMRLLA